MFFFSGSLVGIPSELFPEATNKFTVYQYECCFVCFADKMAGGGGGEGYIGNSHVYVSLTSYLYMCIDICLYTAAGLFAEVCV